MACAFVGGLPASGVPSYTSENAHLGAQTPIAGILYAIFFSVFLFSSTSLIRFIPLPLTSALILSYVCNMTHWREIPEVIKGTRAEVVAWLTTFHSDCCCRLCHSYRDWHALQHFSVYPKAARACSTEALRPNCLSTHAATYAPFFEVTALMKISVSALTPVIRQIFVGDLRLAQKSFLSILSITCRNWFYWADRRKGQTGRKAKNPLYSCIFGPMLPEINNLRNLG